MVSRSNGVSKTDGYSTLNNRNSELETLAITIVIVLRTIPEQQIFTFPIVLTIVLTPQFLWFKIQCPFDFNVNRRNSLRLVHTFQVIWQYSLEISVLYYSLHSWHWFPWFEISNEIERRFSQEVLSPDLKWRKQGLASLGRCCLSENAISPPNREVFKPASKSGYPNIW